MFENDFNNYDGNKEERPNKYSKLSCMNFSAIAANRKRAIFNAKKTELELEMNASLLGSLKKIRSIARDYINRECIIRAKGERPISFDIRTDRFFVEDVVVDIDECGHPQFYFLIHSSINPESRGNININAVQSIEIATDYVQPDTGVADPGILESDLKY
jgi:hypothetical protein